MSLPKTITLKEAFELTITLFKECQAENEKLKADKKKLIESLKTTMGCAYVWDEFYPEDEHDKKCEVCKLLKEIKED